MLNLSELVRLYPSIPLIAKTELLKWIKPYDSEVIDERYLYVSRQHLESIERLTSDAVFHHSNAVTLWLLRFYDPDRVVEEDFLHPELIAMKPVAEGVRETITLLQELITHSAELQQTYKNFQHMWIVYEVSKITIEVASPIAWPETFAASKDDSRVKIKKAIDTQKKIYDEELPLPIVSMSRDEVIERNRIINTTYQNLFWHGHHINTHIVKAAKASPHFYEHYHQPWIRIHRTLNNLARKSKTFINKIISLEDGSLVNSEQCTQISQTRKSSSRHTKKGFAKRR
jgi:hypothetical protein